MQATMRFAYWMVIVLLSAAVSVHAQPNHPHVLVRDQHKAAILQKIEEHEWAAHIYEEMIERVDPYVERHRTDPEWILSRYQMNWASGERYTRHLSDPSGTELIGWEGDAPPHPTVRVTTHKRDPVAPDGYRYRTPPLEAVPPYDTEQAWYLQSSGADGA